MKKSLLLVIAVLTVLSSCGVTANMGSSSDGQKFQDGIYGNVYRNGRNVLFPYENVRLYQRYGLGG